MLGKRKKMTRETTLVAVDAVVRGSVRFSGRVYVNGLVEGDVGAEDDSGAMLIVSVGGRVVGDIRAPFVSVAGVVQGNVQATECIEVAPTGVIEGNVRYRSMEMLPGASVVGELRRVDDDWDANVHKLPARREDDNDVTAP